MPEPTGQVIAFVRDPKKFRINKYVQYIPTPKVVGVYAVLDRDHQARVVADADFAWEDGEDRPQGRHNVGRFTWQEFQTFRRDYAFTLGWLAQEQAGGGWKPFAFEAAAHAQQAMTNRTQRVVTLLETAANWGANTASANALNGGAGTWDKASDDPTSPQYNAIRATILEAVRRIFLGTNAQVGWTDLCMVISPGLAIAMAKSAEILNYLRESPYAMAQVKGDAANQNVAWGLPETYCGMKIEVEDAVIVTERPKASGTEATTNRAFVKQDNSAVIVSRPGGLDAEYGAPSFSTIQVYHHKQLLQVQAFDDPKNEKTDGHVVENFKEVLAAAASGFLVTGTM